MSAFINLIFGSFSNTKNRIKDKKPLPCDDKQYQIKKEKGEYTIIAIA